VEERGRMSIGEPREEIDAEVMAMTRRRLEE